MQHELTWRSTFKKMKKSCIVGCKVADKIFENKIQTKRISVIVFQNHHILETNFYKKGNFRKRPYNYNRYNII